MSWVFFNIEMPCIKVICDMEDTGVKFDFEYRQILSDKYNKLLQDKINEFYKACDKYAEQIERYKRKNPKHKL